MCTLIHGDHLTIGCNETRWFGHWYQIPLYFSWVETTLVSQGSNTHSPRLFSERSQVGMTNNICPHIPIFLRDASPSTPSYILASYRHAMHKKSWIKSYFLYVDHDFIPLTYIFFYLHAFDLDHLFNFLSPWTRSTSLLVPCAYFLVLYSSLMLYLFRIYGDPLHPR